MDRFKALQIKLLLLWTHILWCQWHGWTLDLTSPGVWIANLYTVCLCFLRHHCQYLSSSRGVCSQVAAPQPVQQVTSQRSLEALGQMRKTNPSRGRLSLRDQLCPQPPLCRILLPSGLYYLATVTRTHNFPCSSIKWHHIHTEWEHLNSEKHNMGLEIKMRQRGSYSKRDLFLSHVIQTGLSLNVG